MTVLTLDRKTVAGLSEGEGLYWDTKLKGFGLLARRDANGTIRRSFVIQFRFDNKQRKIKLGDAAKINVDQARKKAEKLFAQITLGVDPMLPLPLMGTGVSRGLVASNETPKQK